jgi:hypothetical protein
MAGTRHHVPSHLLRGSPTGAQAAIAVAADGQEDGASRLRSDTTCDIHPRRRAIDPPTAIKPLTR